MHWSQNAATESERSHKEDILCLSSRVGEVVCEGSAKVVAVGGIFDRGVVVVAVGDHVDGGLGRDGVQGDLAVLNADHVLLAVVVVDAGLVVVVEETVHAGRVDEHVLAVENTETPRVSARHATRAGRAIADGELGVVVVCVEGERVRGTRVGLHVGCLSLDETSEDGRNAVKLVVVENGVL